MPIINSEIPASLPPGGAAGGDLTGTYPNPTIGAAKVTVAKLAAAVTLDAISAANATAADVSMNSHKLTNLATPVSTGDATTKSYVDAAINGLDWKQACRLATAATLPANVYANGAAGVGATLIASGFGALTVDGVAVAVADRILVKTEAAGANNGIYVVTATGGGAAFYTLTRATDYNQTSEIVAGTGVYVTEGTANADTSWVMTTIGAITVGTTALVFTQFGAAAVSSVFGRTGAVVAATNDYSYSQISGTVPIGNLARAARSSNTILAAADKGQLICATAAYTQTLTAAAALGAGWWCLFKNDTTNGTTVVVIDPNASETIDALTTATLYSGETRLIECDGSNFFSQLLEGGFAKFTPTGGNFIVPAGIEEADVVCVGSGGQGGGGFSTPGATSGGGSGGGGGAVTRAIVRGSDLTAGATVTVTVAAGGSAAGAAGAPGSNGTDGGTTSFGTLLKAGGGGGGTAAASAATGTGGGGGGLMTSAVGITAGAPSAAAAIACQGANGGGSASGGVSEWGGAGGAGSSSGTSNVSKVGGSSIFAGPGGGCGGAISGSANAASAGGNTQAYVAGGGGAAGTSGGSPSVGTPGTFTGPYCGTGGGGGGGGTGAVAGKDGGAGSIGAGGGGGGSSQSSTAGNGGAGGAGECRIWYS